MAKNDLDYLKGKDNKTLAEWWCILNRWEWPDEIPNEEHPDHKEYPRRSALMSKIEKIIGLKACNREWNIDRMTDEEHEAFWKSSRLV